MSESTKLSNMSILSELRRDWVINKGSDTCPTCHGCRSIYIYDDNKWVEQCDVCPDCYGYGKKDSKKRFDKYGYARGFGKFN